jgi:hypothetical protein
MDTWSILRSFVIFYGHLVYVVRGKLVYVSPFWYFVPRKIWQPSLAVVYAGPVQIEKKTWEGLFFKVPFT